MDTREISDDALLEQVLARSDAGWRELMRRFRSPIFRCIQRAVGPIEADDAFGEFCISVLAGDMRRLRVFDASRGARLCSWLCLLAIKAAYDHQRRVRRFVRPGPSGAGVVTALDEMLEREAQSELAAMVDDGTARDRELYRLLSADADTETIAMKMGITSATVYSKKNKLIERLRARLAA